MEQPELADLVLCERPIKSHHLILELCRGFKLLPTATCQKHTQMLILKSLFDRTAQLQVHFQFFKVHFPAPLHKSSLWHILGSHGCSLLV